MKQAQRIQQEMDKLGLKDVHLANKVGVSKSTVGHWTDVRRKPINISSENLLKLADVFDVSPEWITGRSQVRKRAENIGLVRDHAEDDDVHIAQYQDFSAAAGHGVINNEHQRPTEYVTFKRSWLNRKCLVADECCVIYADGESMADRVQSGDVVLVNCSDKTPVDGRIYVFLYAGVARLKRIMIRASGNIVLISDNDPDGTLREEISTDTFEELDMIGRAIWVGGDLR